MKKVMLFIASMLFAVGANAAALSLTSVGTTFGQVLTSLGTDQVVAVTSPGNMTMNSTVHDEFSLSVGTAQTLGHLYIGTTPFVPIADTQTFSVLDSSNSYITDIFGAIMKDVAISGALTKIMLFSANSAYKIVVDITNVTSQAAQYSFTLATPIPAALFLFAPALLGFFGLRRKATSALAA